MNQSDDFKNAKKKSEQPLGDLNRAHKRVSLKKQIDALSQQVQKKIQPVTNLSLVVDKPALVKLNQEFDNLITDTNLLAEQTKKLVAINVIPIKERYKIAKQRLPLHRCFIPRLDKRAETKDQYFFLALEQALDNTAIINAQIHEATLFKVGVLYHLYQKDRLKRRVVEMSIALRKDDLPDSFKYIGQEGKLREASWIELGEQAYQSLLSDTDAKLRKRFAESCKSFIMVYEGIESPVRQREADTLDLNAIKFPEIPASLAEASHAEPAIRFKESATAYFIFTGNELTTLQRLIPEHKKKTIFIPEIGGVVFAEFMRECLSEQVSVKEHEDSALRKRTAADQFRLKACRILSEANIAMENDKIGKVFDAHAGYVSFNADPDNIMRGIKKEYEKYREALLMTQACQLSGRALTKAFFEKVLKTLNNCLENERKSSEVSFNRAKEKSTLFRKDCLKLDKQEAEQTERKYQLLIQEMRNFECLVERVGAEHIKIFAAELGGKASYSIPKALLLKNASLTAAIAIAAAPTVAFR